MTEITEQKEEIHYNLIDYDLITNIPCNPRQTKDTIEDDCWS